MTDREKLTEKLTELLGNCAFEESITIEPVAASRLINYLIAHGVTIREPGYWQLCKDDSSDNRTRYWRCSVCKGYRFHNGEMRKKYKHCPNCGNPINGDKQ